MAYVVGEWARDRTCARWRRTAASGDACNADLRNGRGRRPVVVIFGLVVALASGGVAAVTPSEVAFASSFPAMGICPLPPDPANPPGVAGPNPLDAVRDHDCIPTWGIDYYRLEFDPGSNIDYANGRWVNAATATVTSGTLLTDNNQPQIAVTVSPSYVWRAWFSALPAPVQVEYHIKRVGFDDPRAAMVRTRGLNGAWGSWDATSSSYYFGTTSFQRVGLSFTSTLRWRNDLPPLEDTQLLLPIVWGADNDAGHVGAGGTTWALLNIDAPGGDNSAPTAGFTATSTGTPGEFQFVSTSTDPDGDALDYEWDFGDGTSASGVAFTKQYAKPGSYLAKLTVTDTGGLSATAERQVTVEAPKLTVDLSFPGVGSPLFSEGDEFEVEVEVSTGTGLGDLSSVRFDPAALEIVTGGDVVEIIDGPVPAVPSSLVMAPNSSRMFAYTLRARAAGSFELGSSARARDAAGREVVADPIRRNGRVGRIDVVVSLSKDEVDLENTDDGPVPQDLDVTVAITNPTTGELTDVTVDVQEITPVGTPPRDVRVVSAVWLTTDEGGAVIEGRPSPDPIESLGPGERREVKLRLRAKDDGKVAVRVLVHADAAEGPLSGAGSAELRINDPVWLYFEAAPSEGTPEIITPGSRWRITGKLVNRTADRTIIARVVPKTSANAHGGVPFDIVNGSADETCGIGLVVEIEPGDSVPVAAFVATDPTGGTRSEVHYDPDGFFLDDNGKEQALDPEMVRVKSGSDVVRVSVLEPTDKSAVSFTEGLWIFTDNAARHYGQTVDGFIALAHASQKILETGADPTSWPANLEQAYAGFANYVLAAYENLTPEEQAAWRSGIARLYMGVARVTFAQAQGAVDASVQRFFEPLTKNYYDWNSREVIAWLGSFVGDNPDLLLDMALGGYGLCTLVGKGATLGPRAILRGAAKQASTLAARIEAKGIRGFLPGDVISFAHLKQLFGVDAVSYRNLLKLAREWDIVVMIRSRGKGAIKRLMEGSVFKPEKVKIKNVNQTDIDFLGFHPNDADLVVIKDPGPWADVEARLGGADAETVAKVKERWQTRYDEWHGKGNGKPSDLEQMQGYVRDGIPVPRVEHGVHGIDNGVPADPNSVWERRPLDLQDAATTDGRSAYRVRIGVQSNPTANWVPGKPHSFATVTGDIDPIAFLRSDLSPLPAEARQKLYRALRFLGFQHPETLTWNNAAGRLKYLTENHALGVAGAEPLAAIFPNQNVRAAYFDAKKAWADPDNADRALIWFHGAEHTADPIPVKPVTVGPSTVSETIPYIAPGGWMIPRTGCEQPRAEDGSQCVATVQFSNDADVPILRQPGFEQLEAWDGTNGWKPYTAPAGDIVKTKPQTMLTATVAAGATRLPIATASALGMAGAGNDWFEVGQTIVIDPGGPNEERATITGFGSIIVAVPLRNEHQVGETIAVIGVAAVGGTGATTTTQPASSGTLPRTGGGEGSLASVALALVALGALLLRRNRRRISEARP